MSRARLAAIAGLLLTLGVSLADAQPRRDSELGDKQRDLRETQRRLSEERAKAADAKRREAGVLSDLEATEKRLGDKRRQIAVLAGRMKRAEGHIGELEREIAGLHDRRAMQEEALARRLRALYKLEVQGGALLWLLAGQDPVGQAVQLRHLAALAAVDARLIREYRVSSDGLAERKDKLEARRRELVGLRAEAEEERAEADREAGHRQALLARVRDERAYHERMVGELTEAARRLEAFVRDLQEKQRQRVARVPPPSRSRPGPPGEELGTGFARLRGRLVWPVDGRVVGEYGAQVHPRFGTKTFRHGVDIGVPEGTKITAVAPGQVLYTGWFRGYGNLIILDHGGEYYTLYGHAAEIRVAEGEDVKQGQVIGAVGDTGSLEGARLYFEVRHQGRPQDPTQWLQPRG